MRFAGTGRGAGKAHFARGPASTEDSLGPVFASRESLIAAAVGTYWASWTLGKAASPHPRLG